MYQWNVWYFNDKIYALCSCVFNFVNTKQTEHSLYGYHICVHCILLQYYSPKPCEANMWGSVSIKQVPPKMYFQIISIYILHIKTVVSTGIFLKENVSVTSTLYIIYVCVSKQSNCCIKGIINIKNNKYNVWKYGVIQSLLWGKIHVSSIVQCGTLAFMLI